MKDIRFREYSKKHIHFYGQEISDLLSKAIKAKNQKNFSIVDLGCGDGNILFSLKQKGLLSNVENIVGVDLSPERIENMRTNINGVIGIISDACNVKELEDEVFDVVIASQLIEHVPNDINLLMEVKRLLKSDGVAYISSVFKKWYGIYIYRYKGKFRLDPTHIREYSSKDDFLDLLEKNGLKILECRIKIVKYPLTDIIIRILIKTGLIKPSDARTIYLKSKWIKSFRRLLLPIFGYYSIGVLCEK